MRTKIFSPLFLVTTLLCGIVASIVPIGTSTPKVAADGFNPNLLVSDAVFTAKDAMSVSDIQNFLVSHGSVLAQETPADLGDPTRGAAQIIWDAAHSVRTDFDSSEFGPSNPLDVSLNPEVILATLQKEASLVTGAYTVGSPTTLSLLSEAMGYGCPDSGGCNPTYSGFVNQVTYGAAQLYLDYYRAANSYPSTTYVVGQTYTIPAVVYSTYCTNTSYSITMGNASTSSLYHYTPHVCNGNANFWIYMNTWFGDTVNQFSPVAEIIKAPESDALYMYWPTKNEKWNITSMAAISAWAIVATTPIIYTDADLAAIPTEPGAFSNLQLASDGTVYYLEGGKKYHIRNGAMLPAYGVSWADLQPVDDSLLGQLPTGAPLGFLTMSPIRSEVYYITAGRKYYVPDGTTLANWGFTWDDISEVTESQIDAYPSGGNLTSVAISEDGGNVYLVTGGQLDYIPSIAMLTAWGLSFNDMTVYGKDTPYITSPGPTLTQVAKASGADVYYITNGTKRYVSSASKLKALGLSLSNIIQVSDSTLNALPLGSPL